MSDKERSSSSRKGLFLLVLAAIVGGLAYFAYQRQFNVRGAYELARESTGEAATTAKVKTAFALSSRVSAFDIDVDTQGGVVRLEGQLPSEETRKIAVAIAEGTAGVVRVEDQLTVDPEAQPSEELESLRDRVRDLEVQIALVEALSRAPELSTRSVTVAVRDGVVTLEGRVQDAAEREGAEQIAASLDGVVEVENELEVTGGDRPAPESEESVAKRAEFALFATDAFDLERLNVRVEDGVAALTGEVRSQAERLLAERVVADVDGIDRVDNQLEVLSVFREAELEL